MAYLLLTKPIGTLRPLAKIARTQADIEDVRDHPLTHYSVVETSDNNVTPLINDEKVVQSYDGTTLNIINSTDEWLPQTTESLTRFKDNLIKVHERVLNDVESGSQTVTASHKTKIENSLAALKAFDISTLGTGFTYSFHKKLSELGITNILSAYEI